MHCSRVLNRLGLERISKIRNHWWHALRAGYGDGGKMDEPIFTPSKADEGHDENISIDQMHEIVGEISARN